MNKGCFDIRLQSFHILKNLVLVLILKWYMKTSTDNKNKILKVVKKISFISLLALIMALNEGCQYKSSVEEFSLALLDKARQNHAEEILSNRDLANIEYFNGDSNFSNYISEYLKKSNKKINADKFTQTLLDLSQDNHYDPVFILAVIKTESSFNFNAIGSAGEIGLMQIKPDTAEWICKKRNIKWKGAKALKDPEYNILVGANYFRYLKTTLNSRAMKYINAYNMGLGSMKRVPSSYLKRHPYFGKVADNYLAIYSELKKIKESSGT